MTLAELGQTLGDAYQNAKEGEKVVTIHLFGIRYADQIEASGAIAKEIAKEAGIPDSYGTEIQKGVHLAKFVSLKA